MSRSLDRRKDVRTEEQFKQDILEGSKREKMLMDLWVSEMTYRGHKITYSDYGVNNSGEFVEKSDSRPDFCVILDGHQELYEVKSNPYDHKQTFKVHDLKTYIQYAASILLFFGLGKNKESIDKETTRWGIIRPQAIEWMIAGKDHRTGDAKWGYKPVVIIYPNEYSAYFKTEELLHIKENQSGN